MREIFSEYGAALTAALVAVGILVLLGGVTSGGRQGLAAIAGGFVGEESREVLSDSAPTGAFEEYRQISVKRICFDAGHPVYSGEQTSVSEHFKAETTDGTTVPLQVVGVLDSEGEEVETEQQGEDYLLYFDMPGVYRIYLRTQSDRVRPKEAVITFPVEEAG